MSAKNNRFQRKTSTRAFRTRITIMTEGRVTEPAYVRKLQALYPDIHLVLITQNTQSAPYYLIKRITDALAKAPLEARDRAWLILDTDEWTPAQIGDIRQWQSQDKRHLVGMSNPNFEYWVLLHFEAGAGVSTPEHVSRALNGHLPQYTKHLDRLELTHERLQRASEHARTRHRVHDTTALPPPAGNTTMYVLVEGLGMGV
jgi:hypothetical protein